MAYNQPKNHDIDYPPHQYLRKPIKSSALIRVLKYTWGKMDANHQPTLTRAPSLNKKVPTLTHLLNVLVVEDNEMNQKVVRRVFKQMGYPQDIPIANNGQEALDMIEKNGLPDMILMDVQMPILDGVQTTKIIRKKYPYGWPYIVSMTADAFPEDRKNCLNAGMNDFLTKPIRVEQVKEALAKCHKLKESLEH